MVSSMAWRRQAAAARLGKADRHEAAQRQRLPTSGAAGSFRFKHQRQAARERHQPETLLVARQAATPQHGGLQAFSLAGSMVCA